MRGKILNIGLAVGCVLLTKRGVTQTPAIGRVPLTVRPRDMATGTTNPAEGSYPLDSLPEMTDAIRQSPYLVYVPGQCSGARRCPLVMHLHGAGMDSYAGLVDYRKAADKYGFIVLSPTAVSREWSVGFADSFPVEEFERNRKNIDAALQSVLRAYAIDPGKIVVSGVSQGTWPAQILGGTNPNVFSRVVTFGGVAPVNTLSPAAKTTEFLAVDEFPFVASDLWKARAMRAAGYRLKDIAALTGHGVQRTTADFVGRWLQESWAQPDIAKRTAPRIIDLRLLTPQTLDQLARVWSSLKLSEDERIECMRETVVPVMTEHPSTVMLDMSVAAKNPAVAALLSGAGLTAEQFDAYRLSLLSARLNLEATEGYSARTLPPGTTLDSTSVSGQNLAFIKTHRSEVTALDGMFLWGP